MACHRQPACYLNLWLSKKSKISYMNSFIVHAYLAVFLAFSIFMSYQKVSIRHLISSKSQKSLPKYLIFIVPLFFVTFIFILFSSPIFLKYFYFLAFSYLLIMFAFWMTIQQSTVAKVSIFTAIVSLILLRFMSPLAIIHNIFIIASLAWLGIFLREIGLLTLKRFVIFSSIWFLYDITFVWLTTSAELINSRSREAFFPLGISYQGSLIGTGDLLFAAMFISLLPNLKHKIVASLFLLISSGLLTIIALHNGIWSTFPLLTIWVPVSLLYFKFFLSLF